MVTKQKCIHVYVTMHYMCPTIVATIKEATPDCSFLGLVLAAFYRKKGIYMYPLCCNNIFQEIKIQQLRTNSQILVLFFLLPAALETKLPDRAREAACLSWLLCLHYFTRRIQVFFSMNSAIPRLATSIGSAILLVIILLLFLEKLKEPLFLVRQ
jgi:hypothetical protein